MTLTPGVGVSSAQQPAVSDPAAAAQAQAQAQAPARAPPTPASSHRPAGKARKNKPSRSCLCLPFSLPTPSNHHSSPTNSAMDPTRAPLVRTLSTTPSTASRPRTVATASPFSTSTRPTTAGEPIRTRILIISDTHGFQPTTQPLPGGSSPSAPCALHGHSAARSALHAPLPEADVVIHCGDLTKRSTIEEYRATVSMLRSIRAPIKIAIAGNHDVSLHDDYYRERMASCQKGTRPELNWVNRNLATPQEAKAVVDSRDSGIIYLEEGTHDVLLRNGARLRVYASPWTPCYGGWAFQYSGPHAFDIPTSADLAVTHGPPRDILDLASNGDNAGCELLFRAVEKARPRVHCYGHIHEGWGAYYGHWADDAAVAAARRAADEDEGDDENNGDNDDSNSSTGSIAPQVPQPRTLRFFDTERSATLEDVSMTRLKPRVDSAEVDKAKRERYAKYSEQGCRHVDITPEGDAPVEKGRQTMFLNTAVLDRRYKIAQFPWLVDIDLAKA